MHAGLGSDTPTDLLVAVEPSRHRAPSRHSRRAARPRPSRRPGVLLGALLTGGLAAAFLGFGGPAGAASESTSVLAAQQEMLAARDLVRQVYLDEKVEQYIIDIVFATRTPEASGFKNLQGLISYGSSPRGSINLAIAAKATAFLNRRGYVVPEDVRSICVDVLRHRIGITYEAEAENVTSEAVISEILSKLPTP